MVIVGLTKSLKQRVAFSSSKRLLFWRNLLAVATLILALLLPLINVAGGASLGVVEKSWSQTFVVRPTDSVALGGIVDLANTQVNGTFTVRSCCGYSTNDIKFSILNMDFSASKDYGVVVGNLTFSWNTGTSEKYEMRFGNGWGQVCDGNGCYPDPLNPSSHNKTIEFNVREVAPATFSSLLTKSNMIIGVAIALGVGLAISGVVILRERKIRGRQNPMS